MEPASQTCPYCAETIKAAAIVCRYCGRDLPSSPAIQPGASSAPQSAPSPVPQAPGSVSIDREEIVDLLTSLVDKSLVIYDATPDGLGRYRLLETVRQYSREGLNAAGDTQVWRTFHRDHFLALAEEAEGNLMGPEQAAWFVRLEEEHENLWAALDRSLGEKAESSAGLRLCGALIRFWQTRGHLAEGREWCERALGETGAQVRNQGRAKVLDGAGGLAWGQGDYEAARRLCEESLSIRRESGDTKNIAWSLNNLGVLADDQGDYEAARSLYEESLALFRALGDKKGLANPLNNLGFLAHDQEDYATAQRLHEESLGIRRELGDKKGIADALCNLGMIADYQGDYSTARSLYKESLGIRRELGDKKGIADVLCNLGCVARDQSDHTSARRLLEESLGLFRELGHTDGIISALEDMAALASTQKQAVRAAQMWGAAERLREEIGVPWPPRKQKEYHPFMVTAMELLGEEAFSAVWQAGREMTLEQAIEYALSGEEMDA